MHLACTHRKTHCIGSCYVSKLQKSFFASLSYCLTLLSVAFPCLGCLEEGLRQQLPQRHPPQALKEGLARDAPGLYPHKSMLHRLLL